MNKKFEERIKNTLEKGTFTLIEYGDLDNFSGLEYTFNFKELDSINENTCSIIGLENITKYIKNKFQIEEKEIIRTLVNFQSQRIYILFVLNSKKYKKLKLTCFGNRSKKV